MRGTSLAAEWLTEADQGARRVYGLSDELTEWTVGYKARGQQQYDQLDQMVARDPEMRGVLAQLGPLTTKNTDPP